MKASNAIAVAVAVLIPLSAVLLGFASPRDTPRLALLSSLPLILVFKPKFITDYFGNGCVPTLLAWIAFISISAQIFIAPFLFK
jgi:hypothetical protein